MSADYNRCVYSTALNLPGQKLAGVVYRLRGEGVGHGKCMQIQNKKWVGFVVSRVLGTSGKWAYTYLKYTKTGDGYS